MLGNPRGDMGEQGALRTGYSLLFLTVFKIHM